jgi:hypothetical protein
MTLNPIDGELYADALAALPGSLARNLVRGVLREALAPMVPAMKANIHRRTGLLAAGLRLRNGRGDRPGRTSVYISSVTTRQRFASGNRRRKRKVAAGRARDRYRVYYGPMVEVGHAIVAGGKEVGRVPPYPWMRPAFDALVEQAAQVIETRLGDRLEEAFAGTAAPSPAAKSAGKSSRQRN